MSVQPREPLTAEERALASQLPRLQGTLEPDARLDARVLAAARDALATPAHRPRDRRWIAPMAVAASLSLAVGLAWRLQPPAAGTAQPPRAEVVATDLPQDRSSAMPDINAVQTGVQVTSPPMAPAERPRPTAPPAVTTRVTATSPGSEASPAPPVPPAPPATHSGTAPERTVDSAMVAPAATAPVPGQGMAKAARTGEAARESAAAAQAPRPPASEAARAASAAADQPQPFLADDPGEDVPPATADSPEVRDAWLGRIGELLQQGRIDDARASLAEFRRRYPEAPLPPDLRALEP